MIGRMWRRRRRHGRQAEAQQTQSQVF